MSQWILLIALLIVAAPVHAQDTGSRVSPPDSTDGTNLTSNHEGQILNKIDGDRERPYIDLLRTANQYWSAGDRATAIAFYEKAVNQDPAGYEAQHNLGVACAKAGQLSRAVKAFVAAVGLRANDVEDQRLLALAYYDLKDYQSAANWFTRVMDNAPDSSSSYSNLGYAYAALNEYEKAETAFKTALQKRSDSTDALIGLCLTYANNEQKAEQAVVNCSKAHELDPNSSSAAYLLGVAYVGLNRDKDALPLFARSLELEPNSSRVYLAKGLAEFKLNELTQSLASFSRAAELEPRMTMRLSARGLCCLDEESLKKPLLHWSKR
jgi:tetratricopeptide (TPR) repeat protein